MYRNAGAIQGDVNCKSQALDGGVAEIYTCSNRLEGAIVDTSDGIAVGTPYWCVGDFAARLCGSDGISIANQAYFNIQRRGGNKFPDAPPTCTQINPTTLACGSLNVGRLNNTSHNCPKGSYYSYISGCTEFNYIFPKPGSTPIGPDISSSVGRFCETAPKRPQMCVGNPIDVATGNKRTVEVDFVGPGPFPLKMERYYNSSPTYAVGLENTFGTVWRSAYSARIYARNSIVSIVRPDGTINIFRKNGVAWQGDADINDRLTENLGAAGARLGWRYENAQDGSAEYFDADGRITSIVSRSGYTIKFKYSTVATPREIAPGVNYLIEATDQFGRAITFKWNSDGYIESMTDPMANVYRYVYDGSMLKAVSYPTRPDQQPMVRTYVYNEPEHTSGENVPTLLTGIIDENAVRFATYDYDTNGRAIGTKHAGDVEKFQVAYDKNRAVVIDPLGSVRTYSFTPIVGFPRLGATDQPAGSGCAAAAMQIGYDQNGNPKSETDFNANKSTYVFDPARNLEKSRTEAAGTPKARTISTEWHPQYRLPIRIAEPKRLTTFSYLPNGNLEYKTIYPTSDPAGALGLNVKPSGEPIKFSYTYYDNGLPKSAVAPRFEGDGPINETYTWEQGNLATITNAVGHVTTFGNYNANGLPQTIKLPNGVERKLTYFPRGQVETSTDIVGLRSRTTRYDYELTGKLKRITFPDGATVTYGYDDAQRLKSITDSVGNSVIYEMDDAGNRLSESVNDARGVLKQRISREYDALGRLKAVTGAVQ
ncbi:DUF6531 domain-containing protein [[Empedobacter] haloabium]|uniref:DUF6531 domain-containing protein n=1 Tax=[Empedobacter] haloabium TaxID=592317 RepID=A0ABZ1UL55_9BURK